MTRVKIAAIVEGHGECEAVPILIRRIALAINPGYVPEILKPLRAPVSKLLREGEIERSTELAARKLQGKGGIIIIVDCDWDNGCPAKDGPVLLKRAQSVRTDMPIAVVLAKKEFEAWFLAAAESLMGKYLPIDLVSPSNPENIRGAKEWLSSKMPPGRSYTETTDQPAFTTVFGMDAARRSSDSFGKCYRDIKKILEQLWILSEGEVL